MYGPNSISKTGRRRDKSVDSNQAGIEKTHATWHHHPHVEEKATEWIAILFTVSGIPWSMREIFSLLYSTATVPEVLNG